MSAGSSFGLERRFHPSRSLRVPTWLSAFAAVFAVAALLWTAFGRTLVDYDIAWALIWGRELTGGELPSYDAAWAPTPHPLTTITAALVSPLGADAAYTVMLLLAFVGYAALLWGVFRLGQVAFSWPVGLSGAIVVASSYPLLAFTTEAFFDVPVAALVLGAAVLEARSPRRGTPVLLLLAVAGLQRPELWLLNGAYWLYLWPGLSRGGRTRAAAIAIAAPLVWVLSDLLITGAPLHSFSVTRHAAVALDVGGNFLDLLRRVLRLPVLACAVVGLALALAFDRSRARVPAGLAVVSLASIALLGAAGLDLLLRFFFIPAAALGVLFGYSVMGWTARAPGRLRSMWAVAGSLVAVAALAAGKAHFESIRAMSDERQGRAVAQADLRSLIREPRATAVLGRCSKIAVTTHLLWPLVAYYTQRDTADIVNVGGRSRSTAIVWPVGAKARALQKRPPFDTPLPKRPMGFAEVAGNGSWRLYARGC